MITHQMVEYAVSFAYYLVTGVASFFVAFCVETDRIVLLYELLIWFMFLTPLIGFFFVKPMTYQPGDA